jgi:hypothetical protein
LSHVRCTDTCERFFESKILIIVVGPDKTPLNVYEDALKQTAFFEVEGTPLIEDERTLLRSQEQGLMATSQELDSITLEVPKPEDDHTMVKDRTIVADYHLYQQDKFILQPKAFKTYLSFLYNTAPGPPRSRDACKSMLQAYGLAMRYRCVDIQNQIIDCVRRYHEFTYAKLEDLVWTINRFGDNTKCLMTTYLVEQIAYEIAKDGFDNFRNANPFLEIFLATGNRCVRVALFKALARHAQHTKIMDPARTGKNWHIKVDADQQE